MSLSVTSLLIHPASPHRTWLVYLKKRRKYPHLQEVGADVFIVGFRMIRIPRPEGNVLPSRLLGTIGALDRVELVPGRRSKLFEHSAF